MNSRVRPLTSGGIEILRRQNNRMVRKNKKKKNLRMNGFYSVLIILLLLSIGYAVYAFGSFLFRWDKLRIDSYKLINPPAEQYDRVREILGSFRGNLLAVNLESLRMELKQIRMVRDVAITRNLPDTVNVRFMLREPVYQCRSGRKYLVLSREGIILEEKEQETRGLVVLKNRKHWTRQNLDNLYQEIEPIRRDIQYVDYHPVYGVAVKLNTVPAVIYPGDEDIPERIGFFLRIRDQVIKDQTGIARIDLRIQDRIYLEYSKEGQRR